MTTAPSSEQLLTADEFYLLPDPPHGGKMELVEGRVVTHMPPGGTHGKRARRLGARLGDFADRLDLGETVVESGFRLRRNPDTVLAPDVAFVAFDRLPQSDLSPTYVDGAPTLAIEVVSPNDLQREVLEKVGLYLDCGVERVWVVREKDHTVIVYSGDGATTVVPRDGVLDSELAGFAVPGFELTVADIFA